MEQKPKLKINNLNKLLLAITVLLFLGFAVSWLDNRQNNEDISVADVVLKANGVACTQQSECQAGLTCVDSFKSKDGVTTKYCSDTKKNSRCDKTAKSCAEAGTVCINNGVNVENWTCQPKPQVNGWACNQNTDCGSGLECVNGFVNRDGSSYKQCSDRKKDSYCDKTIKSCAETGTVCINNGANVENWRCRQTPQVNGGSCSQNTDCASGLECVNGFVNRDGSSYKQCSDRKKDSHCDKTTKSCTEAGTVCNNAGVNVESWACRQNPQVNGGACSQNTDCANGLECIIGRNLNGDKYKTCTNKQKESYCDLDKKECSAGLKCETKDTGTDKNYKCYEDGTVAQPTTTEKITCGGIDITATTETPPTLNIGDFGEFAKKYNKLCNDTGTEQNVNACGKTDTNADGKVGIVDFGSFARRYSTPNNQKDCTI